MIIPRTVLIGRLKRTLGHLRWIKPVQVIHTKGTARMTQTGSDKLKLIPDVDIDPRGRFKYILVKVYVDDPAVTEPADELSKFVVRGYADCPFHGDIYDRLLENLNRVQGLDSECVGGGRILHENKKLTVFGYSQGYGQADHSKSVEILKKAYPDYEISWNNNGY